MFAAFDTIGTPHTQQRIVGSVRVGTKGASADDDDDAEDADAAPPAPPPPPPPPAPPAPPAIGSSTKVRRRLSIVL